MTINVTYDKKFTLKSLVVLLLLGSIVGAYKYGYNKGLRDMAAYVVSLQDGPKVSDDQNGNVGHFGQ